MVSEIIAIINQSNRNTFCLDQGLDSSAGGGGGTEYASAFHISTPAEFFNTSLPSLRISSVLPYPLGLYKVLTTLQARFLIQSLPEVRSTQSLNGPPPQLDVDEIKYVVCGSQPGGSKFLCYTSTLPSALTKTLCSSGRMPRPGVTR